MNFLHIYININSTYQGTSQVLYQRLEDNNTYGLSSNTVASPRPREMLWALSARQNSRLMLILPSL